MDRYLRYDLTTSVSTFKNMQSATVEQDNSNSPSVWRSTASSILAKFLPNQNTEHKMAAGNHGLRTKTSISYAESDGSVNSPAQTPEKSRQSFVTIDGEDDVEDELDQIKYVERTLRRRTTLAQSLKAAENGDKRTPQASQVRSITHAKMCSPTISG